jgi:hypothetical protein
MYAHVCGERKRSTESEVILLHINYFWVDIYYLAKLQLFFNFSPIFLMKFTMAAQNIIRYYTTRFRYKPSFPNISGTYFLPCKKIVSMVYESKPIFVSIYWALLSDWHAQSFKILKSLSQTGNSSAKLKTSYLGPPGKANIKSWEVFPQIILEGPIKGTPKTIFVHVW